MPSAPRLSAGLATLLLGLAASLAVPPAGAGGSSAYAGIGMVYGAEHGPACEWGLTVGMDLVLADGVVVAHAASGETALSGPGSFLLRSEPGATTIEFDCGEGKRTLTAGPPTVTSASCDGGEGVVELEVAGFTLLSGRLACAA